MSTFQRVLSLGSRSRGLHEITSEVAAVVGESPVDSGLCNVFLRHTSASLCINENADPSVRADFEGAFNRLAPENHPDYTHTFEGSDDMPAHIKSALTNSHLTLSVKDNKIILGTWQGLYLFEHRLENQIRKISYHFIGN